MSIWKELLTEFNEKLPRRTAVLIKENPKTIAHYYPLDFGRIGYNLDMRTNSTYDEKPDFTFYIDEYALGDISNRMNPSRIAFYFKKMESAPNYIERQINFATCGLVAKEQFASTSDNGVVWDFVFKQHTLHRPLKRRFFLLFTSGEEFKVSIKGKAQDTFILERPNGRSLSIALSAPLSFGLYDTLEDYRKALLSSELNSKTGKGKYFVLPIDVEFEPVKSSKDAGEKGFPIGMSSLGPDEARANIVSDIPERTAKLWDKWFKAVPAVDFKGSEARKAYYKCWTVVKQNYYEHEKWGHILLEALPVYKGVWTWGTSALPFNSLLDPYHPGEFLRNAFNLFFDSIRDDGYIPHAIYIDEEKPGERWGKGQGIIQTPHFPWVALAYYKATKDKDSLRRWYEPLVKFYNYICKTRDKELEDLHLWAAKTSFDTGLDVSPLFTDITYYGEEYVYPAIFAAERCRYERTLAEISRILGKEDDVSMWLKESELTLASAERILWNPEKVWFGVRHADGTLETSISLDGLFFLAYGLVSHERAEAMRPNFEKLIAGYGIFTMAPGEPGYEGDFYWRGPAWPKSCAVGANAASNYYPDLKDKVLQAITNWALKWPSIWECLNGQTGEVARGDVGIFATPCISSNVGAGELIGAFCALDI